MKNIRLSAANLRRLMNLWPPFWAMGIRVEHIDPEYRHLSVSSTLRFYNQNYVRTHFGGTLFALTDPFYMLMMMHRLGKGYTVWDQSASIHFKRPGKGKVTANFQLTDEMVEEAKRQTAQGEKYLPTYQVAVVDEKNEVVAEVSKTLYIRAKPATAKKP